jgi:hypothetical protein
MGKIDAMRDPFLAQLIYVAETVILNADRKATESGFTLTDSNVRSVLMRAKKKLHLPPNECAEDIETKENILEELEGSIIAQRLVLQSVEADDEASAEDIPVQMWKVILEAVIESIEIRRSPEPGSRCYLDFLHTFIES